jgi:hypothetical protein
MDNGLNLVAVNNSWGDREMPKMLSIVVTKLGEKGVVSVFSSGNLGIDSDYNSTSPSVLKDNPYAIVVDGSNKNGENVYNYGVSTTDVVAPGVNILTTASSTAGGADYLAEADKSPLASDHFDDTATDTVRAYKVCDEQTLAVNAADRVGSTDTAYYYESGNSLGIGHGDLATFDDGSQGTYLKIPVTSEPSSFLFDYKLEQHYLSSPEFSAVANWTTSPSRTMRTRSRGWYFPVPPLAERASGGAAGHRVRRRSWTPDGKSSMTQMVVRRYGSR